MFEFVYQFDPQVRLQGPRPTDPDTARRRLESGNADFAALLNLTSDTPSGRRVVRSADLWAAPDGSAPVQVPFVAVLGCSDARVPVEMVFGQGLNDVFVVRVAGNVLGDECLGSLDYAVAQLAGGLKMILVLGHSGCGAVTAAVDAFLDPSRYLAVAPSHPLRTVVDRIMVAVRVAQQAMEEGWGAGVSGRIGYREALIEVAVGLNAALTAATVREEFRDHLGPNRAVMYGVYDLATRSVGVANGDGFAPGLAHPPANRDELVWLATQFAIAPAVRKLLKPQ